MISDLYIIPVTLQCTLYNTVLTSESDKKLEVKFHIIPKKAIP